MVLFKRKPVQFLPRPIIEDDNAECWIIPETEEVFMSYESYLQRMDWYKSKKFICEISGHSGLTFFDALKSEAQGAKEVDNAFPEALKEPVLRKVQFSTISRIDILVDRTFDEFKGDFYPGEVVTVMTDENTRENAIIRDKATFPEIRDRHTNMVAREQFCRYFVRLIDRGGETLVDDQHVSRDRKLFTKQMLRQFLKNTLQREAWNGAPWLVKPQYADWYRIDTNIPPHLLYSNRQAEKREKRKSEQETAFSVWQANKLPELKPAPKGRKQQMPSEEAYAMQQAQYDEYQRAMQIDPVHGAQHYNHIQHAQSSDMSGFPAGHGHYVPSSHVNGQSSSIPSHIAHKQPPRPPSPPPIKYPTEDMEVRPSEDSTSHRPNLKYITTSQTKANDAEATSTDIVHGLDEASVGLLLETWNTLNVYCQVLVIDSFTFDDFVDAMEFKSDDMECELLSEIHCAVLKKLVNAENDQDGAIQISLPDLAEAEDSEEEEDEDESRPPTPTPEPDVPARRTRSSLNKMQLAEEKERTPTPEATVPHRAAEMFSEEYGWVQRLRSRDLLNGGWELVMVGLLYQAAGRPRLKDRCEKVLVHLAPLDAEPTIQTASMRYRWMDINLRVQALQIICQLLLETKTVKSFLEEMSNTMTQFRKVKIEYQRARKDAIAKLKTLHEERRALAPQERTPTPPPELEDTMDIDKIEDNDITIADSDGEEILTSRSLRRGNDRAAERKRKREEEQERREKAAEAKKDKGSKEHQKVLKAIEKQQDKIWQHEKQIETVDNDLREADCPRTRVLGKDRFCNRYWWFERNAMPYGGLPDSSLAEAGYANGRIWVQGPDDMEREGYVDVADNAKQNYARTFGMTPAERKKREEGPTNLFTAYQWGYYDNPDDIHALITWLDTRGFRELKLKKELKLLVWEIVKYMDKRKEYLTTREPSEEPVARMSTRTKTYVGANAERCLQWRNTAALREIGHRHIDPLNKPKGRGKKTEAPKKVKEVLPVVLNRQGKPVTRQGGRYTF